MADVIENLPPFYNMPYTDNEGKLTTEAEIFNDQAFQTLNALIDKVNNGWTFPSKTNTEITAYGADTAVPVGTVWFSTTDSKLKVKTAASTIEEIQSM